MKRKRYRYIWNGGAKGDHRISDYRLIGNASYCNDVVIRVNIPSDLELTKYTCDSYSTTRDQRTLDELGYDILLWKNRKWVKHNELKGKTPSEISELIRNKKL